MLYVFWMFNLLVYDGMKVFINVPWWYVAYNRMISPFLTQRTKSKFVFAGPTKTAETLFKLVVSISLHLRVFKRYTSKKMLSWLVSCLGMLHRSKSPCNTVV